jgi:hypothetical protein
MRRRRARSFPGLGRIVAVSLLGAFPALASADGSSPASGVLPEILPRAQEVALALSAAPKHLQAGAGVYAFEKQGFVRVRASSNGFTCIVNRDHPLSRKPTCYDAEGTATILPKVLRFGELLARGTPLPDIEAEVEAGFRSGKYVAPRRPGVAYMLSDGNRDFDPRTGGTRPFPPHVMFYAPNLTNEQIGSTGDGADGLPFIAYPGPHAFIIMMIPSPKDTR